MLKPKTSTYCILIFVETNIHIYTSSGIVKAGFAIYHPLNLSMSDYTINTAP